MTRSVRFILASLLAAVALAIWAFELFLATVFSGGGIIYFLLMFQLGATLAFSIGCGLQSPMKRPLPAILAISVLGYLGLISWQGFYHQLWVGEWALVTEEETVALLIVTGLAYLSVLAFGGLHLGEKERTGDSQRPLLKGMFTIAVLILAIEIPWAYYLTLPPQKPILIQLVKDYQGRVKILQEIENGADVNATYAPTGNTALHIAAEELYSPIVEILIENGAEVQMTNRMGWTPLLRAVCSQARSFPAFDLYPYRDSIRLLLDAGSDPNLTTPLYGLDFLSPLMCAARNTNDSEVFSLLLDAGADLEQASIAEGRRPLFFAAREGHPEAVVALVEAGANPNSVDLMGNTVLHAAFERCREDHLSRRDRQQLATILEYLLNRGVDPSTKNSTGKTAYEFAQAHCRATEFLELLKAEGD